MSEAVRAFARDQYIPVRDAVAPANQGDLIRHGIVRAAFLSLLNRDARVLHMYAGWAQAGGLLPRMWAVQVALRTLGAFVPLPPGIQTKELPEQLPVLAALSGLTVPLVVVEHALAAVREADRALSDRLAAAGKDPALGVAMVRDAEAFVKELGLPWPWLMTELLHQYTLWVVQARLYEARYTERLHAGLLPASVRPLPRGKIPDKDEETLKRYALWFYRVKVRGEKVAALARELYGAEDDPPSRRRDVRYGVQKAESLLELGQYRFRDVPP